MCCLCIDFLLSLVDMIHIEFIEFESRKIRAVYLSGRYHERWWFEVSNLYINVSDSPSTSDEDMAMNLKSLGFEEDFTQYNLWKKGCTYVSMEGIWPIKYSCDGRILRTPARYHITLGYLAPMTENSRWHLKSKLNDVLAAWLRSCPTDRPHLQECFYRRKFDYITLANAAYRQCSTQWDKRGIVKFTHQELAKVIAEDRLRDPHYDEGVHGDRFNHLIRKWRRDCDRQSQAEQRARLLRPNDGWMALLHIGDDKHGWSLDPIAALELSDCCSYIVDWAYFHPASHWILRDNSSPPRVLVIPPLCSDEEHFHCTRQDDWLIGVESSLATNEVHRRLCALRGDVRTVNC